MIIPSKKMLFIHIPKCAGTFIEFNLLGNQQIKFKIKNKLYKTYRKEDGHCVIGEEKHNFINYYFDNFPINKLKNDYFKFSFVRNPYDRILSLYNYMKRGGINEFVKNHNFAEWIDAIFECFTKNKDYKHLTGYGIQMHQYLSKSYPYKNEMDFIGRTENLDKDFKTILSHFGYNITLSRPINVNQISTKDYRNKFTEPMQKKCEEMFEKDLNLFNYDF